MEIDPVVGEGKYTINLYKPELLGNYDSQNPLCNLTFTVGPVTAIEDEVANKEGIVVYGQPVEDELCVYSSVAASDIRIYSLSGQMILYEKLDNTTDDKYFSISVKGLAAGYYIVTLNSVNGKIYRSKFIKK